MPANKAVFWDRDGVINKVVLKNGKPFSPRILEEFVFSDSIGEILKYTHDLGFLNIIISNQPDLARGLISWDTMAAFHDMIKKSLAIDDIVVCPHDNQDHCLCRKPKPGMITRSARKWDIDLKKSFLIGDQAKDIMAGQRAGCRTIFLKTEYNGDVLSDYRVDSLTGILTVIDKKGTNRTYG